MATRGGYLISSISFDGLTPTASESTKMVDSDGCRNPRSSNEM